MGREDATPPAAPTLPARLVSLDAYRGFIMLAMASGGLALAQVAKHLPDGSLRDLLAYHFDHVAWVGGGFWDMIQPSFMFMVGVAMPYSYASRHSRGDSDARIMAHVLWRALVLVLLGVFLSSNWSARTDWTFTNVLSQIGLGYAFVYLLINRGPAVQLGAAAAILVGYWLLFVMHPLPGPDFNYAAVHAGPAERFVGHPLFAHFDKNANFASDFDRTFLNWFPRPKPFVANEGGYTTLNFVPSMATMIFGLMAGELLRSRYDRWRKLVALVLAGGLCLAVGVALGDTVCPIIKRIWSPSWAVYSSGWTFFMLAAFYAVIDVLGFRRWAFPLVVVGMNSIAMYCMAQLSKGWIASTLQRHLGEGIFEGPYGATVRAASVLAVMWLVCLWLYRRRVFIRI